MSRSRSGLGSALGSGPGIPLVPLIVAALSLLAPGGVRPVLAQQDARPVDNGSSDAETPRPPLWRRLSLAVGPGLRADRVADGTTEADAFFVDVVPVFRPGLGPSRGGGVGPVVRLNLRSRRTYVADADATSAVHTLPLLGGVKRSWRLSPRTLIEVFGALGYSHNAVKVAADARDTEKPRLTMPSRVSRIEASLASEGGTRVWVDLHPRVAFVTGASYLRSRPRVGLADGSTMRWNGDRVRVEAGVAVTVLKARR